MQFLSGAVLEERDFSALLRACADDASFPRTYAAWRQLIADCEVEARAKSWPRPAMKVDPVDFAAWCEGAGLAPCLDTLRVYLLVKRTEV